MLSGVILVVILILLILQGSLSATNDTLVNSQNTFRGTVSIQLLNHRTTNLLVVEPTGNVYENSTFPCCVNIASTATCTDFNAVTRTHCNTNKKSTTFTSFDCPSRQFNNITGICG
jgi:hypothetical protein